MIRFVDFNINQLFGKCKTFFASHERFLLQFLENAFKIETMRVTGAKIRQFREGQGLTTSELATKINPPVTRQAIEYWEKNGVGAFRTLTKIADALGVNPALLLDSGNGD